MNQFQTIYDRVITRLDENLPPWLYYHSVEHTKYILEKAIFIAHKENLGEQDLFLLKLAALYHDSGFIWGREKHEELGCAMAQKELKEDGLNPEQIEKVCNMILATKIPQTPKTKLEKILSDADLEYLGTSNFKELSNRLFKELLHYSPNLDRQEWNKIQFDFMSKHTYHTDFCLKHLESRKLLNLEQVKKEMRNQN